MFLHIPPNGPGGAQCRRAGEAGSGSRGLGIREKTAEVTQEYLFQFTKGYLLWPVIKYHFHRGCGITYRRDNETRQPFNQAACCSGFKAGEINTSK